MTLVPAASFVAVTALACFCLAGCAGTTLPVRVLSSEAPSAPHPEASDDAASDGATTPSTVTPSAGSKAPRIGAPGGSGAGSRRVVPVQSGNETVGGLPAGTAGPTGAAGLG